MEVEAEAEAEAEVKYIYYIQRHPLTSCYYRHIFYMVRNYQGYLVTSEQMHWYAVTHKVRRPVQRYAKHATKLNYSCF